MLELYEMDLNKQAPQTANLQQPKVIARIARALRPLARFRGWIRLIEKVVPAHQAPFVVQNGKLFFAGDFNSYLDRHVYLFGGNESLQIQSFLSCIPADRKNTILDIGANAGTHSSAFAQFFKTVHSFEPNPQMWPQFEKNIALNSLNNVVLHKVGLGDKDTQLTFHMIDKPNFGLGTFSTKNQYDLPLQEVGTLPIKHGGKYLAEIKSGKIDAIKVDVQGFEPQVLKGLEEILRRDQPIIWCEIGDGTDFPTYQSLSEFIPFKFRCFELAKGPGIIRSIQLKEHKEKLPKGDYILIPIAAGRN